VAYFLGGVGTLYIRLIATIGKKHVATEQANAVRYTARWCKKFSKVSSCRIINKSYYIVIRPASEIRLCRQFKVSKKHQLALNIPYVTQIVTSSNCALPATLRYRHKV